MNDAISTGEISGNTGLRLLFPLGIFLVEMTSLMFLSEHRDTQAIFYLLNVYIHIYIYTYIYTYIYIYIYITADKKQRLPVDINI